MWVVDQIYEGVVCLECVESKELVYVRMEDFPKDVRVGECFHYVSGKWLVDAGKTEGRKERIKDLFAKVRSRKQNVSINKAKRYKE